MSAAKRLTPSHARPAMIRLHQPHRTIRVIPHKRAAPTNEPHPQTSRTHKRAAPTNEPHPQTSRPPPAYPPTLNANISTTMGDINKALEDLRSQESPNYSATAIKWNVKKETLRRRHLGKQQPRQTAQAEANGILSPQQNKDLVAYICKLSARGTPPIPAMVRNFAYEISKRWPGKNWTATFKQRNQNLLDARVLAGFELARVKADNSGKYQAYFDLVGCLFAVNINTNV